LLEGLSHHIFLFEAIFAKQLIWQIIRPVYGGLRKQLVHDYLNNTGFALFSFGKWAFLT
jgi:hypothetical protein